jgi:hypothetical protein
MPSPPAGNKDSGLIFFDENVVPPRSLTGLIFLDGGRTGLSIY